MDNSDRIKRIIRGLKKEEERMICGILGIDVVSFPLIWNTYFDLKKPYKGRAKYTLDDLIKMSHSEFEEVINEYFSSILERFCKQRDDIICPILNIPMNSDISVIKKRFRELAKTMHPDTGGSHEDFLALYEVYEKLINKN